jgi:hypothetical protein
MSGLFDEEDGLVPGAKPSEEPEVATPVVEEIGLFSDEAKADMRAARDKAKAVAKEKAKQAGQAATQVAKKARGEWLPKAKAWWAAERAKGIHKGVSIFGVGMALLTVGASGAIWWHAQPHLTAPKAEAPKVEVPATAPKQEAPTPVVQTPAPVAQTPLVAPAPQVQPQVEAITAPDVKDAPTVEAPTTIAPKSTTRALKPLPFNPTSREYRSAAPKPKATASKPKAKTAWEKEQEAKLDAFFKH